MSYRVLIAVSCDAQHCHRQDTMSVPAELDLSEPIMVEAEIKPVLIGRGWVVIHGASVKDRDRHYCRESCRHRAEA